ncbi:MAG: hypothetical protein DHS20C15_01920 [Planctomycetota bacterium]|nr:MAG: hypothetical protein DHS20C15_01920 [Planctomycetota bacterium]
MLLACALFSFLMPHGGQYLPPLRDDAEAPPAVLTQPGTGPTLPYEPDRWEWWFDFQEEELLDLRVRLARLPAEADGAAWRPSTESDRVERVLPVLQEAARRSQRDLRATAALALGRLAEPAGVPTLLELTEDRDLFVRAQAILALGVCAERQRIERDARIEAQRAAGSSASTVPAGVADASVLARLDRLLDTRKQPAELFTYAAAALGLMGGPDAELLLGPRLRPSVLEKTPQQQRAALINAAGLVGSAQLDAQLLGLRERWIWTHDGDVRALVAVALGRSGRAANLAALLQLLADADSQVRRSAAAALNGLADQLSPTDLARVLTRHGKEKDVATRLHLLHVLGRARAPAARARLLAVLARRSAGLERPYAALGLGLDGHPDSVDALIHELDRNSERSFRGALAMGLGLAADGRAIGPLLELFLDESEPAAQAWLALALGLLGTDSEEFLERVEHVRARTHDPETLRLLTTALALVGRGAQLREELDEMPVSLATSDRAALVFAHGQFGDRRSLAALIELASDEEHPSYLRRYALGALGQICEPAERSFPVRLSRLVEPHHKVGFLFELNQVY